MWNLSAIGEDLKRIATSLEHLVLLEQTSLASKGLFVALDNLPPEEDGEVLLTDPEQLAQDEARREKYAREVGLRPTNVPGPLAPDGGEWPPEAEERPISFPKSPEGERKAGSGGEGFLSAGPEGAESDEGSLDEGWGEKEQPSGHIPR